MHNCVLHCQNIHINHDEISVSHSAFSRLIFLSISHHVLYKLASANAVKVPKTHVVFL